MLSEESSTAHLPSLGGHLHPRLPRGVPVAPAPSVGGQADEELGLQPAGKQAALSLDLAHPAARLLRSGPHPVFC